MQRLLLLLLFGAYRRHHRIGLADQEQMLLRRQVGRLDDAALALPCTDRLPRTRTERAVGTAGLEAQRTQPQLQVDAALAVEVQRGLGFRGARRLLDFIRDARPRCGFASAEAISPRVPARDGVGAAACSAFN